MDLEKVTAKIRPRRGWEAIDLGITFVQQHAKILYQLWFLVSFPIFLVVILSLYSSPVWAAFILWWLIPIMERPLLHFLSRELFGESLSVKQCAKAFFSVAKIQWLASLTWRRLSFTRSLDLPLIQLEGLKSVKRASRLKTLHSGDSGSAVWLTIIFFIIEIIFFISFLTLLYMLIPEAYLEDLDIVSWVSGESETNSISHFSIILGYLCVSLVAPLYVACGFSLYLNQRTHLEAWDIELSFKRLAARLSERSENIKLRLASFLVAGFLCLSGAFVNTQDLQAAEPLVEDVTREETKSEEAKPDKINPTEPVLDLSHENIKEIITDIKAGNDFHQKKTIETNEYRSNFDTSQLDDEPTDISSGWLIFAKLFALVVEFALWIFVAVLVIFLVLKYKHLLGNTISNKKVKQARPKKLFGLDLDTESLPEKPWLVAKQLVEAEQYRQALSLLYRASLIWYIDNSEVVIKEGFTELECVAQIVKHVESRSQQYIRVLTQEWRALAYAHIPSEKNRLIELCENWPLIMKVKAAEKSIDQRDLKNNQSSNMRRDNES